MLRTRIRKPIIWLILLFGRYSRAHHCWAGIQHFSKIMAPHSTPCLWFVEIGFIDVDSKHHVTCLICEDGVRLCSCVIEELFAFIYCALGGCQLFWRNGTQQINIVLSTALTEYKNVLLTCIVNLRPSLLSGLESSSGVTYCILDP